MPGQAKLDVTGALHHIMVRGNNKTPIFVDERERKSFLPQAYNKSCQGGYRQEMCRRSGIEFR
jgi:hypothetical protein